MRRIAALSATFAISVASCAEPVPDAPVSVAEAIDNIHAWDGEIVTVYGWLGNCQGMDCAVYPTQADAQVVERGDYESVAWKEAMDRRLSIGFDETFDRLAIPLQFRQVEVSGRLSDICRGWMTGCTDRAPDLQPNSIEPMRNSRKAE